MSASASDLTALAAAVERQGVLLQRIADHLGIGDGDPSAPVAPQLDDSWRRLGLAEGERRTVTVLFADLCGYTDLAEELDPEEADLLLKDTMGALAEVVVRHGGHVEKFIGDALCAIYGAPVAHDDEPDRAARSALEMHTAIADRSSVRPDLPALALHAGINTGIVIAGAVGDGSQFGVTGDTINTAARLMGKATSGQTFCSAETARRLRRHFLLEGVGDLPMKGKVASVATSNLLRALCPDEIAAARRPPAPLVGREPELARLLDLVEKVAAGSGAAVLLSGEAGSGKSRLLDEVAARAASGTTVLRASGRVAGTAPLGFLSGALAPIVDLEPGPGLTRLLVERAEATPLVVLLDDVAEADDASLTMLRDVVPQTAEARILWVLSDRTPARAASAAGGAAAHELRLRPLAPEAVSALLEALLPGALDPAQEADLAARTGGNPEYAEALATALVDDGFVVEGDGGWELVGELDELELPGSVAELVEARICDLSTSARVTLQDAAVIGVRFTTDLLHRSATLPASVDAALAELLEAGLVERPDEAADDGPLRFWSMRSRSVRDVAYESVLRRRRPAAHKRVAEGLLGLHGSVDRELAELVSYHLERAGEHERAATYATLATGGPDVNATNREVMTT